VPLRTLVLAKNEKYLLHRPIGELEGQDLNEQQLANRFLQKVLSDSAIAEYLPEKDSFFDTSLSPDITTAEEFIPTAFDVHIDNRWFFGDLDKFSRVYSQIYAFFYCSRPQFVTNLSERVRNYLHSPWTGGFSRVNLFEAMKKCIPSLHDLEIREITYASPGSITIEALPSVGDSVLEVGRRYLKCEEDASEIERKLRQALSSFRVAKLDLSSKSDSELPLRPENTQFLQKYCDELVKVLEIKEEFLSLNASSPNIVVSTKVLLALVLRIRRIAQLQSRGFLT